MRRRKATSKDLGYEIIHVYLVYMNCFDGGVGFVLQ